MKPFRKSLSCCYLNFWVRIAWLIERGMLYQLELPPKPLEHWSQFLQVWVNSTLSTYKLTLKTQLSLSSIKVGCCIEAQSQGWTEISWNESDKTRKRNDHLNCVCLISGWDGGALWITNERSSDGQQQWNTDTFRVSTTYLLVPSAFPRCAARCLGFEIFTVPSCFSSGIVLCPVIFCSSLIRLILLFTVLLYGPQLTKGNTSLYWQRIVCVRLRLRHILSRESFRNTNTELKVQQMNIQQAKEGSR